MIKKIFRFFLDSVQALVLALSVFVLLYLFVAQPSEVNGYSMEPNFHDKEFVLTEKISYKRRDPQRGEVVVFKAPSSEPCAENECDYIKRVIGLPGETIQIFNDRVWVNGEMLREEYLPLDFKTESGSYLREGKPLIVPQNEYLLLGDNRSHSRDGREFGTTPKGDIVGRAFFRYWPTDRLGLIEHADY
jgi:signal peptidase I